MPQTLAQSRKRARDNVTPSCTGAKRVRQLLNDVPGPSSYQQLDLRSHQIRILHLLPGHRKDPLRCVLCTAFLDDDPKYEALSYVWGDPHDCRSIEVDGRPKDITINLYHALRRLRYPRRERCLWVDALCINQDNDTEKSHQVNLMKEIYSRTKKAILWLGDFSHRPNATANQIPRKKAIAAFDLLKSMAADLHYSSVSDNETNSVVHEGLGGLSCLFQLPWWHRAWTVQEAVLPANAAIVCGTIQLPFSQLLQAHHNSLDHHHQGCCRRYGVLDTAWNQLHGLSYVQNRIRMYSMSICDALNHFRARHATDPRDKVYDYAGLGSPISANYALSHEEVFKLTTRSLIEESRELEGLLRTAEPKRSPSLPSWVPDWCAEFDEKQYDLELGWLLFYPYFAAAGRSGAKIRSSSPDVLDLQGLVLDRIVTVGLVMDTLENMKETIAEWQDNPKDRYPNGGTYQEASWRTLIGDLNTEDRDSFRRLKSSEEAEKMATDVLEQRQSIVNAGAFGRKGFSTNTGLIGVGNPDIRAGDSICILAGGRMPFVLRQVDGRGEDVVYQYIGQSYVHGIMDGEMMNEGRDLEWISLV